MATAYKSKFTGEQIDNSVETVVSNTATDGQVLTANGTGGATWQDVKGTEVVANPVLAGTESDLTGLEVAGTKYKVPTGGGTEVVANPSLAGTESDLTGLEVAGTKYKVPTGGGTEVVANPSLVGTESDLTGLEVAGTKYKVPTGGGTEVVANPSLAGTESDLTGLEVAGIKYKVPSGGSGGGTQLYAHHIIIFNVGFDVEFTMYSTVSNAFTIDSWVQYLEPFGSLNVSGVFTDRGQNKSYPLTTIDAHPRVAYILNNEEVSELIDATKFDDTVTPL